MPILAAGIIPYGQRLYPHHTNRFGYVKIGQAELSTVCEGSTKWPTLEATERKLVSPAVSVCENPRNPYCLDRLWLEKFMALCTNCRIDAIAVHWYGCDAKQMAAYLDKRASQFHKPLWLTEWACPNYAGDPAKFMAKALPVIKERVDRYARFAARTTDFPEFDPLVTNAGLTSLGRAYR